MKSFMNLLLISVFIAGISSCGDEITEVTEEITNEINTADYLLTDFGAIGDGQTDCSVAFAAAIQALPDYGGVIVVPEGNFLLDNPVVINRNFVTIRGVNEGLRSNIEYENVTNPGGGSKLTLGNSNIGIKIIKGDIGRISGIKISNVLISGGTPSQTKGTGISIINDNDGIRIENVVCINLNIGISANAADAMIIDKCWISECKNSIYMNNGIQNIISNCQLGAQPGGITVNLTNQENLVFEGNHVYPDGDINLQLKGCTKNNISSNNFQSYYVGMLEIQGDNNLISNNIFWLRNAASESTQLRNQTSDYGVIRVKGNKNLFSSSSFTCDWVTTNNPVTIRCIDGIGNRFSNLLFSDETSNRVFYVNETTEIFNCVSAENVVVDGDAGNVYINY